MRHSIEEAATELYELTEDEMREKLGLPADFRILCIMGTGPFKIYRYNG